MKTCILSLFPIGVGIIGSYRRLKPAQEQKWPIWNIRRMFHRRIWWHFLPIGCFSLTGHILSRQRFTKIFVALSSIWRIFPLDAAAALCRTYTADTMTLDMDTDEFFITDKESLWKGESLYHLYEKAHTPWEWHKPIFDRCKELGILGFSTPFDDTAVDFLEELDVL